MGAATDHRVDPDGIGPYVALIGDDVLDDFHVFDLTVTLPNGLRDLNAERKLNQVSANVRAAAAASPLLRSDEFKRHLAQLDDDEIASIVGEIARLEGELAQRAS